MHGKTIVWVFVGLLATAISFPTEREVRSSRVVGGSNVSPGEVPYQASIQWHAVFHFCGGVIISTRSILTAAHCLEGEVASNVQAVVGSIYVSTGGTAYQSANLINHPEYNPSNVANDIGLLITQNSIVTSSNVAVIPWGVASIGGGVSSLLTGWGQTSHPGNGAEILQKLTVNTITNAACQAALGGTILDTVICTFTRAGEGACFGDSGGPLVANGNVIGLVSWGYPCAIGYPDVYTRVSSFNSWILANYQ